MFCNAISLLLYIHAMDLIVGFNVRVTMPIGVAMYNLICIVLALLVTKTAVLGVVARVRPPQKPVSKLCI